MKDSNQSKVSDAVVEVSGEQLEPKPVEQTEDKNPVSAEKAEEIPDASGALEDESEEAESEESEPADGKPEKKAGYQKRINKLTKQKSQLKNEVEYWRAEALKQQQKPEPSKPVETKLEQSGKPKAEDFDKHEDFVEALTDWKTDQKLAAQKTKEKEQKLKDEFDSKVKAHQQRVSEFVKAHDDFDEVVAEVDDVPMSLTIQQAILESDNGPELMYELAKNRDEYKRICTLSPIQAAREIGRFEARIKAEASSNLKEAKTPKAPKPLKPVGSSAAPSTVSPDEMDFDAFKKWRKSQGA